MSVLLKFYLQKVIAKIKAPETADKKTRDAPKRRRDP